MLIDVYQAIKQCVEAQRPQLVWAPGYDIPVQARFAMTGRTLVQESRSRIVVQATIEALLVREATDDVLESIPVTDLKEYTRLIGAIQSYSHELLKGKPEYAARGFARSVEQNFFFSVQAEVCPTQMPRELETLTRALGKPVACTIVGTKQGDLYPVVLNPSAP